jgi:hypothetical protein
VGTLIFGVTGMALAKFFENPIRMALRVRLVWTIVLLVMAVAGIVLQIMTTRTWADRTIPLANIAQENDTGLPVVGAVGQSTTEKRACRLHRNQTSTARLRRANRLYYECTALPRSGRSTTPQEP